MAVVTSDAEDRLKASQLKLLKGFQHITLLIKYLIPFPMVTWLGVWIPLGQFLQPPFNGPHSIDFDIFCLEVCTPWACRLGCNPISPSCRPSGLRGGWNLMCFNASA